MADDPKQGEAPKPGEPGPAAPAGSAPSPAGQPAGEPVREAPARPLEASAGVPEHGEREKTEQSAPSPAPADEIAVKIIEAPEAKPVSEMKPAFTPSEIKPVLPDEKGVVVFDDTAKVEWGEEKKPGEAAAPKEGASANAGAATLAPAAPDERAVVGWGEEAPAVERPGLPVHPPLPRQFWGAGRDIWMFIRNGTFMFFCGSLVYFIAAMYCLGVAYLNVFDEWAHTKAADFGVAGFLALGLSAGAFACMLLSRSSLEEPLRRNDVAAVRRRLPAASAAGIVFGLVLGGLLLHLARLKVDELPFPAAAARVEKAAGENG
jgi:hypothetical protein